MNAISIIMPCYNRSYDLARTLDAYDRQSTSEPFEVIAVDDGSKDTTFELLSNYRPERYTLIPVRLSANQGPSAARNAGLEHASAPLIVFVGDDILPAKNFVEGHLNAHQKHPERHVAILGRVTWADDIPQNTLMRHIDGPGAQQFSYFYLQDGSDYDYRHLYTANVSIKREMFGFLDDWFDTSFIYAAFEDPELAYRLRKHRLQIVYDASIVGKHYHYHTIWSFATRQYRCGYSAWLFVKKHPGVWKDILPEFWWHLGSGLSRALKGPSPGIFPAHLEAQALHLCGYYEWSSSNLVDSLYIEILKYFYYKGALESFLRNVRWKERILAAYAKARLAPVVQKFLAEAEAERLPLPDGSAVNSGK
jgi:glycosyltransferase involved in cell wall biosynthesis